MTGKKVDFIETAKPAMILVPAPEAEASAIEITGLYFLEVK